MQELNKPTHIFFNKFWPGFLELTNPNTVKFFIEIFKRVFKTDIVVEINLNNADILCEAVCNLSDSLIYKKKWKYSFLITGESVVSGGRFDHYNRFSCFLSGLNPVLQPNGVKFPLFISYLFCNNTISMVPVDKVPINTVCAVISNPKGKVRNKFLDELEKRTNVVYGGSYRNNIGCTIRGDHNSSELIEFIRQFKYIITMENNEEDYYITEKICNGFFAGTIPVYWGSPNASNYFNSKRFLHLKDGTDNEISNIIDTMLSMDDNTYLDIVNTEVLINKNLIDPIVKDIISIIM